MAAMFWHTEEAFLLRSLQEVVLVWRRGTGQANFNFQVREGKSDLQLSFQLGQAGDLHLRPPAQNQRYKGPKKKERDRQRAAAHQARQAAPAGCDSAQNSPRSGASPGDPPPVPQPPPPLNPSLPAESADDTIPHLRAPSPSQEAAAPVDPPPHQPAEPAVQPPNQPQPAAVSAALPVTELVPDVPALAAALVNDELWPDMEHDGKTSFRCHQCKLVFISWSHMHGDAIHEYESCRRHFGVTKCENCRIDLIGIERNRSHREVCHDPV